MNNDADITFKNNALTVQGVLNFANVMSLYQKSLPLIASCKDINVDFSQVKASDSSGVALMMEWMCLGKAQHKKIIFSGVSKELQSIINAAGLSHLFVN